MRKLLYIVMIFIGVSACTSRQESKPYDWDDDLHQRLLADFCLTESQVKDYIRKYIPDVTDERLKSNNKKSRIVSGIFYYKYSLISCNSTNLFTIA